MERRIMEKVEKENREAEKGKEMKKREHRGKKSEIKRKGDDGETDEQSCVTGEPGQIKR